MPGPQTSYSQSRRQADSTWLVGLTALVVLLALILPYLAAFSASGEEALFLGFLQNPIDGHSYLAKMYQGWEGSWRYQMAFTQEPGEGAFLFSFYMFLGHIARILSLPLISVFHGARLLAVGYMMISIYRFFKASLPMRLVQPAFALAVVGSGLGWLAVPFGAFTADLWVAEGYPFLAGYTNPHFPLSLGLMAWILTPDSTARKGGIHFLVLGLLLALILPFGLVIVLGILGVQMLLGIRKVGLFGRDFYRVLWISIGGAPVLLYDLWLVGTDPIFTAWNAQNITATPPFWELLVSFSPVLVIALYAAWSKLRQRGLFPGTMVVWLGVVLVLIYLPFELQRRLLTGIYIPLAGLAIQGIDDLLPEGGRYKPLFMVFILMVSLPTNLIILLAAGHGIETQDSQLFLAQEEAVSLEWIRSNSDPDALILAGPEMGLFIPGQTGRRVIYGHPFETINATEAEAKVLSFYEENWAQPQRTEFLRTEGVDYVFFGPRERKLGALPPDRRWDRVFQQGGVEIYSIPEISPEQTP